MNRLKVVSMLTSHVVKIILLSISIASAPAYSSNFVTLKSQAESFSTQLASFFQTNATLEDFHINSISHQYIFNHGVVFTIKTNIDQLEDSYGTENNNQTSQIKEHHINNFKQDVSRSKNELNQLRLTAKNLAHHEFSLQKQINSMQSASLKSNEIKKSSIDQKIRASQDQMKNLIKERAEVSQKIDYIKVQDAMSDSTKFLSRAQRYKTLLKQTYQLLCNGQTLQNKLSDKEKLTIIFEGLGKADDTGYQNNIVDIEKLTITQCNKNEITAEQMAHSSTQYQY